ncbi:MAG: HEAT repeat domain-containing protein [Phycisphaeraceae bacterium]
MDEKKQKIITVTLCALAAVLIVWRMWPSGAGYSLDSEDPVQRMQALEDLRGQNTQRARSLLRSMTVDPDPRVAVMAIQSMAGNRDRENMSSLVNLSTAAQSPLVRREALAALGEYPEFDAARLVAVVTSERDPDVRAGAAQGLARRADRSTVPTMFRALSDEDAFVRGWAITGIKNVTKVGFMYDSGRPPQEQREVIEEIRKYLQRNRFM